MRQEWQNNKLENSLERIALYGGWRVYTHMTPAARHSSVIRSFISPLRFHSFAAGIIGRAYANDMRADRVFFARSIAPYGKLVFLTNEPFV